MGKSRSYRSGLLKDLKEPKFVVAYLKAAHEEKDNQFLFRAIKNVVEANGGINKLAKLPGLKGMNVYKIFTADVTPAEVTLIKILIALETLVNQK